MTRRPRVLLVEDKESLRTMLRLALEGQGYTVIEARDEAEARASLGQSLPAVVLTDLRFPEGDGFGVLRAAKDADPDLPVIVMTAYGSIQDAVAAMKEGALDFLFGTDPLVGLGAGFDVLHLHLHEGAAAAAHVHVIAFQHPPDPLFPLDEVADADLRSQYLRHDRTPFTKKAGL